MQYAQAHADLQSQQAEVNMQQQANLQAAVIMQQRAASAAAAQVAAPKPRSAGWPMTLSPQNAVVLQQMALENGSIDIGPSGL